MAIVPAASGLSTELPCWRTESMWTWGAHAVGTVQEVAAFIGQGVLAVDQTIEDGSVDGFRMSALADLRQLLRIPE